ncbi:hypothetical protein EJB05_49491, partial [Eragrostis curvula]
MSTTKFCREWSCFANCILPITITLIQRRYQLTDDRSSAESCLTQEISDNNCVYRNEVHHSAGEQTQVLQDVAFDPTFPRTKTVRCGQCGHGEVVFFQVKQFSTLLMLSDLQVIFN